MSPMGRLWLGMVIALLMIASSTAQASVFITNLECEILMAAGDSSPPTAVDLTAMSHNDTAAAANCVLVSSELFRESEAASPCGLVPTLSAGSRTYLCIVCFGRRLSEDSSHSSLELPILATTTIGRDANLPISSPFNGRSLPYLVETGVRLKGRTSQPAGLHTHSNAMKRKMAVYSVPNHLGFPRRL